MADNAADVMALATEDVRILVENGEYPLLNRGDVAMLSITVQRLRDHWPDARIGVLTDRPELLRAFVPQAEPIDGRRGGNWQAEGWYRGISHVFSSKISGPLTARGRAVAEKPWRRLQPIRSAVRARLPLPSRHSAAGMAEDGDERTSLGELPNAAQNASLVLAGGGGYITDADLHQAHRTLNLIAHAYSRGIPTAMVGQGIGPITDPRLWDRAAEVLPCVDFIALREGRHGTELLAQLGVAPEKIMVTGDDAVEFGYRMRRTAVGPDLGLCLRDANYSKICAAARETVGRVVRDVAGELNAGLVPLIVSEHGSEDRRSTLPLLEGYNRRRRPIGRFGTAEQLARQVSGCRALVSSTYHVAVFALSQGIPVVSLTTSAYYDDKFYGLADMFGMGLTVVHLDDQDLPDILTRAIRDLWHQAPTLRRPLQQKAIEQIGASNKAFERISRLVATNPRSST